MQITQAFYQMAKKDSTKVKMMPTLEYMTLARCVNYCAGDVGSPFSRHAAQK